jgi:type I restriction enzyme M protein
MSIFGQENDLATWALARMNMFLHNHPTAELWKGNTLSAPYFKKKDGSLQTFDFAVANPPFSSKSWTSGLDPENDEFRRFEYGVPPAKNGDYAFLLHLIKSLKSKGKGAIILPHGVLFRGNREADIRRRLIQEGLIKGIIGLPANLFYGTGIPACIIVIDKEHAHVRTGIFMIDASREFIKDGNKNRLREQDIHRIVDVFNRQLDVSRYSLMVPVSVIAGPANDYSLNIPRYIDSSEPEDLQDLDAHLRGGIPNRDVDALETYWDVFPSLRTELFEAGDRPGYSRAKVETQAVKPMILQHPEFAALSQTVASAYEAWRAAHESALKGMKIGVKPKAVITSLSEDLLVRFASLPLLDKYDVYQRLMDYWAETMQDDVFLIGSDGWIEAAKPRPAIDNKERKIRETPDLTIGRKKFKMDLIPPVLVVARYFAKEQAEVAAVEAKREEAERTLDDFVEENSGEEGLLEDAKTDKGTVTKASVKEQLIKLENTAENQEERAALARCLDLIEAVADAAKEVREAQAALDLMVLEQYGRFSETEIKTLVSGDKWMASIRAAVEGEVQRLTKKLASRVRELEERYGETLQELEDDVESFTVSVEEHLREMGLVLA